MKRIFRLTLTTLACTLVAAPAALADARSEPALVRVQHVLIAFKGSVRGKEITRTKEEAKALAASLLARAQQGEEFAALVEEYTDDRVPGIYLITNRDAPIRGDAMKRADMAPSFGDVAFSLAVGEVGLAKYHAQSSPFGWHIIKRLE